MSRCFDLIWIFTFVLFSSTCFRISNPMMKTYNILKPILHLLLNFCSVIYLCLYTIKFFLMLYILNENSPLLDTQCVLNCNQFYEQLAWTKLYIQEPGIWNLTNLDLWTPFFKQRGLPGLFDWRCQICDIVLQLDYLEAVSLAPSIASNRSWILRWTNF